MPTGGENKCSQQAYLQHMEQPLRREEVRVSVNPASCTSQALNQVLTEPEGNRLSLQDTVN